MHILLASQNPDGGWPYRMGGPSWTEPTAYSILALRAQPSAVEAEASGLRWLQATQRMDGGWTPCSAVHESTWATAVAALLGPAALGEAAYHRAIAWIVERTGEDTSLLIRIRQFLTGNSQGDPGWPWFPGTSAWVTPTALSLLALRKAQRFLDLPKIRERLGSGVSCLLERVCHDGGWNHGAPNALGYDAGSYPETTGAALLALAGETAPRIQTACLWARRALPGCRTSEGESWLRLGLLAHGQLPGPVAPPFCPPRTIQSLSLALLAENALRGSNPFLEE
ncbi:MAG: prenyltransferase/squalene oxidase repeat-containing protein [Bryobacteraceae bacterium]